MHFAEDDVKLAHGDVILFIIIVYYTGAWGCYIIYYNYILYWRVGKGMSTCHHLSRVPVMRTSMSTTARAVKVKPKDEWKIVWCVLSQWIL